MKFKLKVTIKLSECRGYDHWGSPLLPSLPPSTTPCSVNLSDVGVALGMQIMSNVTSNFRQDAQLQRGARFRFYLGHKNFLESGEGRGRTGLSPPDLRHCDLLPNPFSVIGCRRKQSHISLYASATAFAPLGGFFHCSAAAAANFTPSGRGTSWN